MIHKSRTVTTHNLAKQHPIPTELIATEEVPSKNKNNQKHFVIFRSSIRFFASLGDVILQLYVGTKNG